MVKSSSLEDDLVVVRLFGHSESVGKGAELHGPRARAEVRHTIALEAVQ